MTSQWWRILTWGAHYDGPRGPWASEAEAEDALARWRERKGYTAGNIENLSNLRIAGPFPSRSVARDADISDYTNYLVRDDR